MLQQVINTLEKHNIPFIYSSNIEDVYLECRINYISSAVLADLITLGIKGIKAGENSYSTKTVINIHL